MDTGESRPDPPELTLAAKQIGEAGVAVGRSLWGVATAFRALVAADLSLSRSAFGMTLALTGVAIVFGASAWLLLMALAVFSLQSAGLSLVAAVAVPALFSLFAAIAAAWAAIRVFGDTRLNATRRQLARFSLAEDPEHVQAHPERVP